MKPAGPGHGSRASENDHAGVLIHSPDTRNSYPLQQPQRPYRSKRGRIYQAQFKSLKRLFEHADALDQQARVNRAPRVLEYLCSSCGHAEFIIVREDDGVSGLCLLFEEEEVA